MNYTRSMENDTLVISLENGTELLRIRELREAERMSFILSGELRNEIAYEFEDELTAVLTVCRNVRIDMSRLEFISSAGLRALLNAQHMADDTAGCRLVISGISDNVKKIFEENGFTELFEYETAEGDFT